ncbi:MAG: tripartite tricarboxylate transporter substrate binding protein [Pigmentiphaga sp.]|uniref:Bug family tripartite tricarboxylate transporter substrate binding protein n=1 Tax=Pigmentiphaga sp. TaxID=1977564 RepID=UPI0029AEEBFB|nr:tripartite tricarboxylate transporter substrate binding protein [Pigmentiphaga sp.]MDX3904297.1 tripartite tricarboxylate transporter substrate binding protein [Pigmentiphaga sp.]
MFFSHRPRAGLPSRMLALAFAIAVSAASGTAAADDFPSHAIKFVVPFVPGSITDIAARYYAMRLGEETGQSVVVENRAGGNGLIGVGAVLNARPDGYTILIGTTSILATNVALYRALPYDPLKDLAALGMMASVPSVIAVPAGSERSSIETLVRVGRAKPDSLNYSAGATSYQLMGELLQEKASFTARAIPYKGVGAALNALIGKEVDFSIVDATSALGSVQGGTAQALAVASKERLALLPNVPTTAEAGLPDFVASTWVAAVAPAGVPAARLAKLEQLFAKIADDPATRKFFTDRGAEVPTGGAATLRARQKEEIELWSRIVKSAKIEQL